MANHLYDRLRAGAPPSRPFLRAKDGIAWSYGDLAERTGRLAGALAAGGAEPGERVLVQVEKTPEALALYLACIRAGAVYVPLNPACTLAEIDYFVGDAEPRLIVCDPGKRAAIAPLAAAHGVAAVETLDGEGRGSIVDRAEHMPADSDQTPRGADDLAAILYTSGTTGRSKGAMLTHGNLLSNALTLADVWRFTAADVLIHALPIYHTHGLFVATNTVLAAGASIRFLEKFDADLIVKSMAEATVLMGVPTFYTRLLAHPGLTRAAAAGIRVFISGSAPLLAETHRAWRERTGHAILERYGLTETSMNTSNPYDGERRAGTVGLPLPGVALRVSDPLGGHQLEAGDIGMIEVNGPNVCKGYWRMPEKTAAEFRPDGFFVTGDLGFVDERGYVSIVGRGKDLVITGGLNVYPKEVETEIDALPGVIESAVFGLPHPDLGEGVTAVVVLAGQGAIDERAVVTALRDRLAAYKLPKRVLFLADLPRNAMGKVQKNLLRERYKDLYGAGDSQGDEGPRRQPPP